MHKAGSLLLIILFHTISFDTEAQNSLTGTVFDNENGTPLAMASVFIPELRKGTLTDDEGHYFFDRLPSGSFLVQVSYLGYATMSKLVVVKEETVADFSLMHSLIETNEVVVTGVSVAAEKKLNPAPVSVINSRELLQTSSTNLIDALTRQPGISQITTGGSISKPVIRGLGYNRVIVLTDGMRQEGQQWGDEHGVEVDEFAVGRVEILKGPGNIIYGSDALAGVINILPPDPLAVGEIKGTLMGNYQTNNGLAGYSASLSGNQNGFVWLGRLSGKLAHDYRNRYDGYVLNSKFREMSGSGMIGVNKHWGYSLLNFSMYHLQPGLPEGERDSSGAFIKQVVVNDTMVEETAATNDDFTSYDPLLPFQEVDHYKTGWMNNWYLGASKLYFNLGYERNLRREYEEILDPDAAALYFDLTTLPYDVRFTFPLLNQWNISAGLNGMFQQNKNKGEEFLIPDYDLFDGGIFGFVSRRFEKIMFSGGLRFDSRSMNIEELILHEEGDTVVTTKFMASSPSFSAFSGSAGITYEISAATLVKGNIARGFRAPNIAELSANGRHEGTFRYEIGNPDLKAEKSWQADLGLAFNTAHISLEASLFANWMDQYIYSEKIPSVSGGDSLIDDEGELIPVFRFTQGDARLLGGEVFIDFHPHPIDWLHFENSFSWVFAEQLNQPDSTRYLPMIPPAKFRSELRSDVKKLGTHLKNAYAAIAIDIYFDQNRVYSAYNTETATPGYALMEAAVGTEIVAGEKTLFTFSLIAANLTDVAYQSHLSRLKYAPENLATGRTGIYNMGRNFSVKIIVPLTFRHS
jgi:iron complex outermembrane receptor protein